MYTVRAFGAGVKLNVYLFFWKEITLPDVRKADEEEATTD